MDPEATCGRRRNAVQQPRRPDPIDLPPGTRSRTSASSQLALVTREMAESLAVLFMAGGSLSLATLLFPHWPGLHVVGVSVPAVTAVLTGVGLWVLGPRLPGGAFHVFLVLGTCCIGTAVHFGGGSPHAIYSPYFVWVSLYAFYFFSPPAASLHLALSSGAGMG